jgi:hypothetical protein
MSVMTAAGTGLPTDRPLTVEDLDLLRDDGNKYELDDGVLIVSPSPAVNHQIVRGNRDRVAVDRDLRQEQEEGCLRRLRHFFVLDRDAKSGQAGSDRFRIAARQV